MRLFSWLVAVYACTVQVAYALNANCKNNIALYNLNNHTAVPFPVDSNLDTYFLGEIDLLNNNVNKLPMTLSADFCSDYVKSAKFVVKDAETETVIAESISNTKPFKMIGDNSKPPVFLKQGGTYIVNVYGYSKTNAHGVSLRKLTLDRLQVLPKIRVSNFAFVDANTGKEVHADFYPPGFFSDGSPNPAAVLYLGMPPSKLSIRVNKTIGTVNSVEFELVGIDLSANNSHYTFLDNEAPFTFAGNSGNRINAASVLSYPGTYRLKITAFSGKDRTGDMGSLTYDLHIEGDYLGRAFELVNANSKADLYDMSWFDDMPSYYLSDYPANTAFSIRSYLEGAGTSVEYKLSKYQKVDATYQGIDRVLLEDPVPIYHSFQSKAPFPLAGFSPSGKYNPVQALGRPGAYVLEAIAYAGANKTYPSDKLSIDFVVYPPFSASVSLVDIKSGKSVELQNNADSPDHFYNPFAVDLGDFPSDATFTVKASTNGTVGSVAFRLLRQESDEYTFDAVLTTVAQHVPFSLNDGHAVSALSAPGRFRVQTTLYSKPNQQGDASLAVTYDFTVLPRLYISSFELVDASSQKVVGVLDNYEFDAIVLSKYPAQKTFSVSAKTTKAVKSVKFTILRYNHDRSATSVVFSKVVNGAMSFPLGGKSSNGQFAPVEWLRVAGQYMLAATPFSLANQGGEKGDTLYQDFYVVPEFGIDNFAFVDASKGKDVATTQDDFALVLDDHPVGTPFDLRAVKSGNLASVEFELYHLDGTNNTKTMVKKSVDNKWPYTVSAAVNSSYSAVSTFHKPGHYLLLATPTVSSPNKSSTEGLTTAYDFRVIKRRGSCFTHCGDFIEDANNQYCSCHFSCVDTGDCCEDICEQCASLNATACE